MLIHQLRNATFVIESGSSFTLVDPMLGNVGELPPFAYFRHKLQRNPLVPLPGNAQQILDKVTHCLVTHSQKWGIDALTHTDHFDAPGKSFIQERNIPVVCREQDSAFMQKMTLRLKQRLNTGKPDHF